MRSTFIKIKSTEVQRPTLARMGAVAVCSMDFINRIMSLDTNSQIRNVRRRGSL